MRVLSIGLSLALLSLGCGSGDKKKVNDPCANNTDCADNICHSGICVSSSALSNGSTCGGKGECKSLNCVSGSCAPGTVAAGGSCLFAEECAQGADAVPCTNGKCGGASPDGGSRVDSGAACGAQGQACCPPENTCTSPLLCQDMDGNLRCLPKP